MLCASFHLNFMIAHEVIYNCHYILQILKSKLERLPTFIQLVSRGAWISDDKALAPGHCAVLWDAYRRSVSLSRTADAVFRKCEKHVRGQNLSSALENIHLMLTLKWSHNVNSHTQIAIFKERRGELSNF